MLTQQCWEGLELANTLYTKRRKENKGKSVIIFTVTCHKKLSRW